MIEYRFTPGTIILLGNIPTIHYNKKMWLLVSDAI